jgi:hypothetical protein
VLHINRGVNIDAGREQLLDILPAFSIIPITTSTPCVRNNLPAVSIAKVLPTPADAPKNIFNLPRCARASSCFMRSSN